MKGLEMRTNMCCATADAGRGNPHKKSCLVVTEGAKFVCSCPGPYCDENCDGQWELPDGWRFTTDEMLAAVGGGDLNRPEVWDGDKFIPYSDVVTAAGQWLGWPG